MLERAQFHIPYLTEQGDGAGKLKRGIFENTLKNENCDASHKLKAFPSIKDEVTAIWTRYRITKKGAKDKFHFTSNVLYVILVFQQITGNFSMVPFFCQVWPEMILPTLKWKTKKRQRINQIHAKSRTLKIRSWAKSQDL